MANKLQIIPLEPTERDYQLAGAVAPHVTLTGIGLVTLFADMRQPPGIVVEQMAKGDLPATVQWRHDKEVSPSGLDVSVRLDFKVEFGKGQKEDEKAIEVTCGFVLGYSLDSPPPEDSREELISSFAKVNAVYNAWPYMREIVQNTMARMNVPAPVIPVFRAVRPSQRPKADATKTEPSQPPEVEAKSG